MLTFQEKLKFYMYHGPNDVPQVYKSFLYSCLLLYYAFDWTFWSSRDVRKCTVGHVRQAKSQVDRAPRLQFFFMLNPTKHEIYFVYKS